MKIEQIEQLRKELSSLINERIDALLKEETKFETGKWYKLKKGEGNAIACYRSVGSGYGISGGTWIDNNNWTFEKERENWVQATDKEVEDALKSEAIKQGFKVGCTIDKSKMGENTQKDCFITDYSIDWQFTPSENRLRFKGETIFYNGKWAEIIQDEVIKIGGYEVKKTESGNFLIGCKTIMSEEMKHLQSIMAGNGFKTVSFDGTEVSLETINKILDKL